MKHIYAYFLLLIITGSVFAHGDTNIAGRPGDLKAVDRVIFINADDIKFDPKAITVRVGETVKFVITNHGVMPHEFVIGDKAEQDEHEKEMQSMGTMKHTDPNEVRVNPGETKSLIWRFGAASLIEYACHVPGHYAAGMIGTAQVK